MLGDKNMSSIFEDRVLRRIFECEDKQTNRRLQEAA
jgi:hypothetical protein